MPTNNVSHDEFRVVDRLLSDPTIRAAFHMRTKMIYRRRIHGRRVALAASVLIVLAGTVGYAAYNLTKGNAARPTRADESHKPVISIARLNERANTGFDEGPDGRAAERVQPNASMPSRTGDGHSSPELIATEFMTIRGQRFPLYGPHNAQGGLEDDWIFSYRVPARVASVRYDADSNGLDFDLDLTAPRVSLDEAKSRIEAKLIPKRNVKIIPLPIRRYELTIRDPSSGEEKSWSEDTGHPSGEMDPQKTLSRHWDVPAELSTLRNLMAKTPKAVAVRLRMFYTFRNVANGVVRTGIVGGISRTINEVIHPMSDRGGPQELLVDRGVRDKLQERLASQVILYMENAGLEPEAWADLKNRLANVIETFFKKLNESRPVYENDNSEDLYAYKINKHGEVEFRPFFSASRRRLDERESEYFRKYKTLADEVRDVAKHHKNARDFHRELKARLKQSGSGSVDVLGIFGAEAEFHLEKDTLDLTKEDSELIEKSREFVLKKNVSEGELHTKARSKVEGEMEEQKTWAKEIHLVRLDRRELERRIGTVVQLQVRGRFEERVFQTELPLEVAPDADTMAYLNTRQTLEAVQRDLRSEIKRAGSLRRENDSKKGKANLLAAQLWPLHREITEWEKKRSDLDAEQTRLTKSIENSWARIADALASPALIETASEASYRNGLYDFIQFLKAVGYVNKQNPFPDPGVEPQAKANRDTSQAKKDLLLKAKEKAIEAEKENIQNARRQIDANARAIDEARTKIDSKWNKVEEISAKILELFN